MEKIKIEPVVDAREAPKVKVAEDIRELTEEEMLVVAGGGPGPKRYTCW